MAKLSPKGARIALMLERKSMTVADLAGAILRQDAAIRRMMREGRLDAELTAIIAGYFKVSPEWIQSGLDYDAPEWAKSGLGPEGLKAEIAAVRALGERLNALVQAVLQAAPVPPAHRKDDLRSRLTGGETRAESAESKQSERKDSGDAGEIAG